MGSINKLPAASPILSLADEIDRYLPSGMRRALSRLDAGEMPFETDWVPAVDVKEDAKGYVVTADVPGVDPKAIKVELEDGVLSISGERDQEKEEANGGFKRIERFTGVFVRRFLVPDAGGAEQVSAKSANGVLTVRIPKAPARKARQIPVAS